MSGLYWSDWVLEPDSDGDGEPMARYFAHSNAVDADGRAVADVCILASGDVEVTSYREHPRAEIDARIADGRALELLVARGDA